MDEQPIPEESSCPNCGGDPANVIEHRLQALGYKHDDIHLRCEDCGKKWTAGVPIGTPDSEDLRCDACMESDGVEVYGRANWIRHEDDKGQFSITVKCPRCFYVWSVSRDATNGATMVHDPVVAGDDEAENPFTNNE